MAMYCVTGAAGHLGSHVVKALVERGDRVRALVLPGERCPDFVPRGEFLEEIEGDVRDVQSLSRLTDAQGRGRGGHPLRRNRGDHRKIQPASL